MSETERDLLAAVKANPKDDLPRLVYADWVEEHKDPPDPDRAYKIREGVEHPLFFQSISRTVYYSRKGIKRLPATLEDARTFEVGVHSRRGFNYLVVGSLFGVVPALRDLLKAGEPIEQCAIDDRNPLSVSEHVHVWRSSSIGNLSLNEQVIPNALIEWSGCWHRFSYGSPAHAIEDLERRIYQMVQRGTEDPKGHHLDRPNDDWLKLLCDELDEHVENNTAVIAAFQTMNLVVREPRSHFVIRSDT